MRGVKFGILPVFFVLSCSPHAETVSEKPYFDIKSYISKQADSLQKQESVWSKTVITGGKTEEKKFTAKDAQWNTELALFLEADLNKKAYQGKFEIDSSDLQKSKSVRYRSSQTKVKEFDIRYFNEDRSWPGISCKISKENLFYQSEFELISEPFQYYSCKGFQKIKGWGRPKEFEITWEKSSR
jgi:hypothetical protein